ncbi:MAG: HD domain-containing protein [Candidatus Bathyarchaeia archaeon]
MKRVGEIKDPVHGYIFFTDVEKELIDARPVQRLRRIKQLAGTDLTYPGATHTRFLHSLGAMHLSGLLASHLSELGYLTEGEVQKVRIAGLLHDVGHGPFSHTYEEVLDKHRHMTHEDIAKWLIRESEIGDILAKYGFSKEEMASLAVGRLERTDKPYINSLVAGHFAPDILDYLVRDAYFAGVEFGRVDIHRLINSLDLIDDSLAIEYPGALYVLESFIIARLEMFNAVYFHRTVRAANVMLARAMDYANEELGLTAFESVDEFLSLNDDKVLMDLLSLEERDKKLSVARSLAQMWNSRSLMKSTYELTVHREDEFYSNILNRASIRRQIEGEIGEKAGVDSDYIAIDVPTLLSVPTHPTERTSTEIPVFKITPEGKEIQPIREVSPVLASLARFVDIIRVYTLARHRRAVGEACEEVFGESPYSSRISY